MRKRLLSALLAMAMVLTMLPMSAFAATGDELAVSAYGFVWNGNKPEKGELQAETDLGGGAKVGSD